MRGKKWAIWHGMVHIYVCFALNNLLTNDYESLNTDSFPTHQKPKTNSEMTYESSVISNFDTGLVSGRFSEKISFTLPRKVLRECEKKKCANSFYSNQFVGKIPS